MDRAVASGATGRGFESLQAYHWRSLSALENLHHLAEYTLSGFVWRWICDARADPFRQDLEFSRPFITARQACHSFPMRVPCIGDRTAPQQAEPMQTGGVPCPYRCWSKTRQAQRQIQKTEHLNPGVKPVSIH